MNSINYNGIDIVKGGIPNTPTVTGYASYNPCACPATTPAPTTAA